MKALYPGSFDPPHLGHLDLIRRAAALVGHLVVGIAVNPDKHPFLPVERRIALLREECQGLANLSIIAYQGATVAYARANGIAVLIRGLRNANDLEAEQAMAQINRANGLDTLLLPSASEHIHISSRMVRLVAEAQLPLSSLVPPAVARALASDAAPAPYGRAGGDGSKTAST